MKSYFLPIHYKFIPNQILISLCEVSDNIEQKSIFIDNLKKIISSKYKVTDSTNSSNRTVQVPTELLNEHLNYISKNKDILFVIYKYCFKTNTLFVQNEESLLAKISNFVESGILLEE